MKNWSPSPYINRFLSADTIVSRYSNPQALNRYSYVINNPLRYTDPTGHRPVEEQGGTHGCSNPKYCQDGKPKPHDKPKSLKDKVVDFLHGTANVTQDLATLVDTPFAITEAIFIVGECTAGPEGCVTGALMGEAAFNGSGANIAETALSNLSFIATAAADFIDDGKLGEDTGTSFTTMVIGGLIWDPIGDLAVDAYGSGYNHGSFNGIETLISTGSLLRK